MLNPNAEPGGGPFARRLARAAMGVWRTPKDDEYANPQGLVGRKVRVYFDGDCTYFEAQVNLTLNVFFKLLSLLCTSCYLLESFFLFV